MTQPALAAASAASPLFPPAAMLSNPGAYLSMPEAFVTGGTLQAPNQTQTPAGNSGGGVLSALGGASLTGTLNPFGTTATNGGTSQPSQAPVLSMTVPNTSTSADHVNHNHSSRNSKKGELSAAERAKQNRDRNREHARSTRLRKKAYVTKLKELVEGLHAERAEEVRQRRVAITRLAEIQNVRRSVVRNFLQFHSCYETDERKWETLLEQGFWLKQPVTPYRSFRISEIEKVRFAWICGLWVLGSCELTDLIYCILTFSVFAMITQDYHVSRGLSDVLFDAASLSVMIESIGSRSPRWMQLKREEFMLLEESKRGSKEMPSCISRQESRLQHAISSLSSSSGSSQQGGSSGEEPPTKLAKTTKSPKPTKKRGHPHVGMMMGPKQMKAAAAATALSSSEGNEKASKVSGSSGSSNDSRQKQDSSKDYHDYHAKPLPDPKLNDSERSSLSADNEDSPEESNSSSGDMKRISTDSSSGDDSAGAAPESHVHKKRKTDSSETNTGEEASSKYLPPNIAKKGGIPHNLMGVKPTGGTRLTVAAASMPPFAGIGKRRGAIPGPEETALSSSGSGVDPVEGKVLSKVTVVDPASSAGTETSSNASSERGPQIRASYHLNEDDMILMDNVLMCPFTFRSEDAVLCGALAECVMPGMLRAHFSDRNKLASLELIYDSMGFMQQLERASGNEGTAQIIPGSIEMALAPSSEGRVITMAKAPFQIVNVNDVWTQITGYTQMEVEGKAYLPLLQGEGTVAEAYDRPGKPKYKLEDIAKGRPACVTNIHYDKDGNDFIEFVCSYPLSK